jgi:hypothetical protein
LLLAFDLANSSGLADMRDLLLGLFRLSLLLFSSGLIIRLVEKLPLFFFSASVRNLIRSVASIVDVFDTEENLLEEEAEEEEEDIAEIIFLLGRCFPGFDRRACDKATSIAAFKSKIK